MQMAQWISLAVYVASAAVFAAAVLICSDWAHWIKGLVLALLYSAIGIVAALVLTITRLPFWSRDGIGQWVLDTASGNSL